MKGFSNEIDAERALRCRIDGCRNRWVVDINFGRVCSHHDAILARGGAQPRDRAQRHQAPIPLRDAVRPFAEPAEHEEEYVHDDPVPF